MDLSRFFRSSGPAVRIIFFVILIGGLALRSYQFFMGRALWEDEAHLALNFIWRGFPKLTEPLDNYQSAPILFLFTIEILTDFFGYSENVLRAFPFFCSIACLPLFYYMVLGLTKDVLTSLLAFLLFSVNICLIYFASELKPYTVDVCSYVLIGYLLLTDNKHISKYRNLYLAIAGCLSILYSNASVIVLICTGLYMLSRSKLYKSKADKNILVIETNKKDLWTYLAWLIIFAFNFLRFQFNHPYAEGMKRLWQHTFPPQDMLGHEFREFIMHAIDESLFGELFSFSTQYWFGYAILLFFLSGIAYMIYTKKYLALLFTVLPILIHFVMAMLKVYPFYYRFILYLVPPILIIISLGTSCIVRFISRKAHFVLAVPLLAYFIYLSCSPSIEKFPLWDREIKPVLSYINQNYPTTKIYVTTPHTALQYYSAVGFEKNKNFEKIEWALTTAQYLDSVKKQKENYLLLYSVNGFADGYAGILKDLAGKNLVVKKYEYKTYGVMEVKPLKQADTLHGTKVVTEKY